MRFPGLLFIGSIWLLCAAWSVHKFYVSNTIIEENVQTRSLEVTVKIFTDDLESALYYQEGKKVKLEMGRDIKHNQAIQTYLLNHFKLSNGAFLEYPMRFVGHETELDLTFIYLEIPNWHLESVLKIENTLLFEVYPEQVNIVHLKMNGWGQTINTTYQQRAIDVFK
jgi:hypothetical protein